MLHDLLETPDGGPDPVAKKLRARLTGELEQRLAHAENPVDRVRLGFFSAFMLDTPDPLARRLFALFYRGMTSFAEFGSGAHGQLDMAIEAFRDLDRVVVAEGPRAAARLGSNYDAALVGLAASCYVRYEGRRELLRLEPPPEMELEIRADLEGAIDASKRVVDKAGSPSRADALATLGSCYADRYEDDSRYGGRETVDNAVTLLREALTLAEAKVPHPGQASEGASRLYSIRDRLAGVLAIRDTRPDVDEAIALYLRNRDDAAAIGLAGLPGPALSLMTAYIRRWSHTREAADRARARSAYAEAFAAGSATHLPAAFDIATQWGGLAWKEHWWAEAGAAYQQAIRVVHLAVRQQGSRADREWIVRKTPGVAAWAALSLARADAGEGTLEDALVTVETGRGVLLTEMFDRRAIDYERIASLAGEEIAGQYQRLTEELTRLEARLLGSGPRGDSAITAAVEETRRRRALLRARMGNAARNTLAVMDGPPTIAELREAAGSATVVYLAATGQGGLALILRPGGAPVEAVELGELTMAAAMDIVGALQYAVAEKNDALGAEVCEELWLVAMERLLPRLRGATEVVFIPGGGLAGLPWHAARLPGESGGYVLDELAISYMPNIRSLPVARAAWEGRPRQLRALAIEAPERTSGVPLSTAKEIAAVQAHQSADFRVTRLPGAEATIGRLRDALGRYEVLHYAGHAFADPDDPLAGALVLADDEHLTVRELLARGIGAGRLAVLSACQTARVEDLTSDEMVSFPTAMVQCGFGGVVGTLWEVPDTAASRVMEAFYGHWRGSGVTPREALRAAQRYTRDSRYATPLAWASFVYVGP
jgi:CHAT domain-containing protein